MYKTIAAALVAAATLTSPAPTVTGAGDPRPPCDDGWISHENVVEWPWRLYDERPCLLAPDQVLWVHMPGWMRLRRAIPWCEDHGNRLVGWHCQGVTP